MKVAIDMSALPGTGLGNYSRALLDRLPILFPEVEIIPVSDEIQSSRQRLGRYSTRLHRLWWEQRELPKFLSDNNIDLLHNPMNYGLPMKRICKSVVTIHDVIPLVFSQQYLKTYVERTYYNWALKVAIAQSSMIITDSEFSLNEITKYLDIPTKKLRVIPLACGEEFKPVNDIIELKLIREKFGLRRPFLLTIGGNEPRKNVARLINIFEGISEKYNVDLVVVGGNWRGREFSREIGNANNVYFLGSVKQKDLIALYSSAELFVFPSLYEGFGLPVLEAMACGVPVAASNTSSIPEVAGDAAILFDPSDQENMNRIIIGILGSSEAKLELKQKGLERANLFTWESTLNQTMEVYREILS